jgi:glycosyltransferase involved in cell wall biosynthesis
VSRAGADVLHTNGIKAHVLTALALKRGQKLLWHVHDFLSWRPIMRNVLPRLQNRAEAAIAISQAVASDIRSVLPGLPIEVLLNGIRTEDFERGRVAPLDLDALAALPPAKAVRIGLIATYAHWKGHELFLEAAARVNLPFVRYFIIGGPVYMSRASQLSEAVLRERIRELRLENRVGLLPFQREPARVYAALDVVIHASTKPEPFGRTVAEGMAAGCALIASAEGGPLEQIRDGVDGLLFHPRDAQALASSMKLLLDNPSLRKELGEHAAERARKDLHAERIGSRLLQLYNRITESPA